MAPSSTRLTILGLLCGLLLGATVGGAFLYATRPAPADPALTVGAASPTTSTTLAVAPDGTTPVAPAGETSYSCNNGACSAVTSTTLDPSKLPSEQGVDPGTVALPANDCYINQLRKTFDDGTILAFMDGFKNRNLSPELAARMTDWQAANAKAVTACGLGGTTPTTTPAEG